MIGHPVKKCWEPLFSVVLLAYTTNAHLHTLGTKNEENNKLQESLLGFVALFRHFVAFGLMHQQD